LLIVPALGLVLGASALATAALRLPNRAAVLLSMYVLMYANIVLVGQAANTLLQLNDGWLWLGLHTVLLTGAWVAWRSTGRPGLFGLWKGANGRIIPNGWKRSLRAWPEVWAMGVGVASAVTFNGALAWMMPPNNNDSLATHMSRVAYWMQRGSFFPWPSQRVWQITYPVNMQLQMFWTALFTGSDRLVEFVQWTAMLAGMTAVYGLARLLGPGRAPSLLAALVWATFPEILLESTTTQNDLVAGTLFAVLFYFLFLALKERHTGALALSGLAFGLALGTKQTLLFLMPGLALTLALLLAIRGRAVFPWLIRWVGFGAAAFLLVGVYMYIVNLTHFRHPMGPETAVSAQTGGQTRQSLADNVRLNTARLLYQLVDPTGLPDPLTGYGFKFKALVARPVFQVAGLPVEGPQALAEGHQFMLQQRYVLQEDAAWYGPVFSFLVLPALMVGFVVGMRRKEPVRLGIFVLFFSFLIVNAAFRPGWDPFQGRYFIPVVTIATPLLALWFQRAGRGVKVLRLATAVLAMVIAVNTILGNSGKPVSGQKTLWQMDQVDRVTLQSFYMRGTTRMVEKYVPTDSTMGMLTTGTFLEYPFFRSDYSRRLVQIYPPEQGRDAAWLQAQGIEFVLVQGGEEYAELLLPASLTPVAREGEWVLYAWNIQ
jgi:4-amino-4-deoxy-L-arabinose transferase-like glycosyltransferase